MPLGRFLIATILFQTHYVVFGGAIGPPCRTDFESTDCALGSYCSSQRRRTCDVCRPCGNRNPDGTIDNWSNYCYNASKNYGVGECPKYCKLAATGIPDPINYSLCEIKLSCGSFEKILSTNNSRASIFWDIPRLEPAVEGANISQVPHRYNQGDSFPISTTRIQYTARNVLGEEIDSCIVNLTVHDAQPPEMSCPKDIILYSTDSVPLRFNWTAPSCYDNSGEPCDVRLIHPLEPSPLQNETITVTYEAKDNWNNTNYCSFNVTRKVVNMECPDIQNATWTDPTIIGGDGHTRVNCNQTAGFQFQMGNSAVNCTLYGDDKHLVDRLCYVHVAVPGSDWQKSKNYPYLEARFLVPVCVVAVIFLTVLLYCCWSHKLLCFKKRDVEHVISPNYNECGKVQNASYMRQNGKHSNPPPKRNGGYLELQDNPKPAGNGVIPSSPSDSTLSTPYSSIQSSNDSILENQCPPRRSEPIADIVPWNEIVGNSPVSGAQCTHTISNLLDTFDKVKRLNVLLDPIEEFLKYVGAAYGIDNAEHKYMLYYSDPHKNPVCEGILSHIKDTTQEDDERQTIHTLLGVMYYYFEKGVGNRDPHIEEAMELIQATHSDCHQDSSLSLAE